MRLPLALLLELAGYAGLLVFAWRRTWAPGELAWGLWSAGFVLVVLWLGIMALLRLRQDGYRFQSWCTTTVAIGLALWALVWIYGFYGSVLDLGFPLQPDPERVPGSLASWSEVRPFAFWPTLGDALTGYPIVVAVSLLPMVVAVRRAWPNADRFGRNPGLSGATFAVLHFTVVGLFVVQRLWPRETSLKVFVVSAVVLSFNFVPWGRIRLYFNAPPRAA